MASVHLPSLLVDRLERLAALQGTSLDRLIAEACEDCLVRHRVESPFDALDPALAPAVLDLYGEVVSAAPRRLAALRL